VSEPDNFLARWSRRKQAVRQSSEPPLVPPPEAPDVPVALDPAALPQPELPVLPALDEITAETDITGFLAKGVSQALRNAALRKMWSLDPAIRDYIGDARDYAYDWNTPGGVPGFGEIDPAYDVQGTLERMFSKPQVKDEPTESAPADVAEVEPSPGEPEAAGPGAPADDPEASVPAEPAAAAPEAELVSVRLSDPPVAMAAIQPTIPRPEAAQPQAAGGRETPMRHGRAAPK
jgi:hypothetical protein